MPSGWVFAATAWRDGSQWRFRVLTAALDDGQPPIDPTTRYWSAAEELVAELSAWLIEIGAAPA